MDLRAGVADEAAPAPGSGACRCASDMCRDAAWIRSVPRFARLLAAGAINELSQVFV
jgi:hypothetical protein